MKLHNGIAIIRLKDRLYKDLTHGYTLLEDVEMLLNAMTIVVKQGEEECL
jgi:hypothetical protein